MFYKSGLSFLYKYLHLGVWIFVFLCPDEVYAQPCIITGTISDHKGEILPYATVRIPGQNKGTIADEQGKFRLETETQETNIEVRYVGYKALRKKINCDQSSGLQIKLHEQDFTIEETIVTSDGKDPAYGIIRNAIERRKYHLGNPPAFKCEVYIKGLQRLHSFPERILGMKTSLDSSNLGIVYLSESLSEYNIRKPRDIREIMVSSKVSGRNNAFSYNQASDMLLDFYESLMNIYGLSERGFISPIAPSAFLYYKYKLLGKTGDDGETIYRIQVIPKRNTDPVFSGEIFIAAPSWRIHATDLYLTKASSIEFVDTLRINQIFIPVTDSVWLPGSQRLEFVFSAMGFKGNGHYLTNYLNYQVNPDFPKNFFSKEILKVNDDANKRDSAYWDSVRPIPLTSEEIIDYAEKDSIARLRENPVYLDSLDRARNKFSFMNALLTGHSWYRRRTKTEYEFSPLIQGIQFNTVEGWVLYDRFSLTRVFESRDVISMSAEARYGFASGRPQGKADFSWRYSVPRNASVGITAGQWMRQFDPTQPVPGFLNTLFTLLDENNLMKLYQSCFVNVRFNSELWNGARISLNSEYAQREAMVNHTDFVLRDVKDRIYSSNNPQNRGSDALSFPKHFAWTTDLKLKIVFANTYVSRPEYKSNTGSRWPFIVLGARGGIPALKASTEFLKLSVSVQDDWNFKMLGKSTWKIEGGHFVHTGNMYFMDYEHFSGNELFIRLSGDLSFQALPYYQYSTRNQYVSAHFVHHFGGWFLNKIPVLKKLKLGEYAGVNFLHVPGQAEYSEYFVGIERLGMQIGGVFSFSGTQHRYSGFRIGSRF